MWGAPTLSVKHKGAPHNTLKMKGQTMIRTAMLALTATLWGGATLAQDIRITTFKSDATFTLNGETFTISRIQDPNALLSGDFARVARPCPADCLQPMSAADGVTTFGELEVLDFLEDVVSIRQGLVLDTRIPDDFSTGSIPGAVNVPFMTLAADNRYRNDILRALGATAGPNDTLDFSGSMSLTLLGGGPWSANAPDAIDHLIAAGYPPEKLFYYRGGMQAWAHAGLTIQ